MEMEDYDIAANAEKIFFSVNGPSLQLIKHCAAIVIISSAFVLSAWLFIIYILKHLVPQLPAFGLATAVAFIPLRISLLLFVAEKRVKQKNADSLISLKESRANR